MIIKVNENTTMRIHEWCEEDVLETGMVHCIDVDCLHNDKITCSECYLDSLKEGRRKCIEYSKVKVD